MAGRIPQLLAKRRLRKVRTYWAGVATDAAKMDAFSLRALRAEARDMRQQLDRVIHAAERHFPSPALPGTPLGTDWVWRPDVWSGPLATPGGVAAGARTSISSDAALYHDCPLGEVALRQIRTQAETDRAPFGLALDVFGFQGSFLSLAVTLPSAAVQGLTARHLMRVAALIEGDISLRAFARLNLRHGPNVEQMVCALALGSGPGTLAEFDMAFAPVDPSRVDRAWVDVIFNDAAMSRILVRDLVVSRRPRAEL